MRDPPRAAEASFEPSRGFHATRSSGRLFVKGAPEVLASCCTAVRRAGADEQLTDGGRDGLLRTAERLSEAGLRVLMVAEGSRTGSIEDPSRLVALGYVGISDPLRPGVPAAVRRCEAA